MSISGHGGNPCFLGYGEQLISQLGDRFRLYCAHEWAIGLVRVMYSFCSSAITSTNSAFSSGRSEKVPDQMSNRLVAALAEIPA